MGEKYARRYKVKLSEHLLKTCPDITPEVCKKIIESYRNYMFDLRQGMHYCDVCYNLITEKEAEKTLLGDFNYCCDKHAQFRNAFQLELVRKQIGLKIEDLPQIDIYG